MNKRVWFLGVCLTAASLTAAHAERWSCSYDGQWTTFNSPERGRFVWKVDWNSTSRGWEVTGNYEDRFGLSELDGFCGEQSCSLRQVYKAGELRGQQFFWKGNYTDEAGSTSDRTVNRISGTWGKSRDARDGGDWRAVATCLKR